MSRDRSANVLKAGRLFADANQEAALLILRDIQKHGGEQALAVRWARAVLANMAKTITGPLLKVAA